MGGPLDRPRELLDGQRVEQVLGLVVLEVAYHHANPLALIITDPGSLSS
jgi:hypothetical protein